ncbi:MAG: N-acetylglucosaminyltransferase [Cytophagales bacterium]|nr:MAG: N-acetylglucosaminyltransferase [Cytophagales bacterium]
MSFLLQTSFTLALTITCIIILAIQSVYFFLLLAALRKGDAKNNDGYPPVSVIVCAHDEEENLRELIPQLLLQQYPMFEVIIVDDRSNDGTYDFLLQATRENDRLKMVQVKQKPDHINGKKFALTLGIKAAQHDWVLLTDADCRPASYEWIYSMSRHFQGVTQLVLGYSPYETEKGLLNSFIRFESLLTGIQFIGMALLGRPYMGVGRNLAYRKDLFLKSKGFHPHLEVTGGDDDLFVNQHAAKENTAVCVGADSLVLSQPKKTLKEFLHQKFRHLSVGKKYKRSDKIWLGMVSVSWILTWFLVLPSLMFMQWIEVLSGFFLLRMLLLSLVMHYGPKKLGTRFEVWKTPFLDFIYSFYYLVTGAKALFVKKVKWKA